MIYFMLYIHLRELHTLDLESLNPDKVVEKYSDDGGDQYLLQKLTDDHYAVWIWYDQHANEHAMDHDEDLVTPVFPECLEEFSTLEQAQQYCDDCLKHQSFNPL